MENTKNKTKGTKINLIVRIRPIISEDSKQDPRGKQIAININTENKIITLSKEPLSDKQFNFPLISGYKNTNQEGFYSEFCLPMIENIFNGLNTTFIAIGQVLPLNLYDYHRLVLEKLILCSEAELQLAH